jgi:hypothetical protein
MARKRVGSSGGERYDGRGDPKRPTRAGKSNEESSGAGRELQQDQHGDDSSGSGEDESRMSRPPDSPPTNPTNRGGEGYGSDRESDGSDSEIEEHGREHEGGIEGERNHTRRNVPMSQATSSRILHQNVSTPEGRSNSGRNQTGQNIVTAPRVPARDTSQRPPGGASYNQQLALDQKDCHNWSLTMKESIRNQVFYLKQFARRNADYGSAFQKKLCSDANVPPELQARFWDTKGKGEAKQALNDKRKTVIGAMKREFLSK